MVWYPFSTARIKLLLFFKIFIIHGHILRTCIVTHKLKSSLLRQTCIFLKYKCSGFTLWFLLHIYLCFSWKVHYYENHFTNTIITVFLLFTGKYCSKSIYQPRLWGHCDGRGQYSRYGYKNQLLLYLMPGYVKNLPKRK